MSAAVIEHMPEGLRIAPQNLSASRCYYCNTHLTFAAQADLYARYGTECPCGAMLTDTLDTWTDLQAQSMAFLQTDAVLATSWFHFTSRSDWADALNADSDLLMHVGTRASAMDRRRSNDNSLREGWLHELRLTAGTPVRTDIGNDMLDAWPKLVSECGTNEYRDYRKFIAGANRYVNHMEDPGSISLLVPARNLVSVSCQLIAAEDATD